MSQSLAKRLFLRRPIKSKHSFDLLVTFFSIHSIYSHGKILGTDLRVTDFGVTLLFVTLGITVFTSQGKRSHWNFSYKKQAQVPEKLTVTEKKLHWIYFPWIPVPEFSVTNAKNTEFSYNRFSALDKEDTRIAIVRRNSSFRQKKYITQENGGTQFKVLDGVTLPGECRVLCWSESWLLCPPGLELSLSSSYISHRITFRSRLPCLKFRKGQL